jgi:hypothetical protein
MMNDEVVRKYLARYAEQEVTQLADFPANMRFRHCLVIPAYNETADFFTRLQLGPLHKQHALCIAVINQPDDVEDTRTNQRLLEQLTLSGDVLWHNHNLQLMRYRGSSNYWLVVDRFSHAQGEAPGNPASTQEDRRIPAKEGVGRARKIGCDLAVALMARSQVESSWIHSTDADAFLPKDYFELPQDIKASAAIYEFAHQNDGSAVGRATALYEQALNYYVKGLEWAGSPYAYPTIGSVLAVNGHSYCQVRGFPRRSGGEDFYLLNKLAKVGDIYRTDQKVRIKARASSRVPFGTGPTVAAIMRHRNPETDYTYYNPKIFHALREWLSYMPRVWLALSAGQDPLEQLPEPVVKALQAADWHVIVQHLNKQAKSDNDSTRALHNWFDAFQTLKFIHFLQAHYYPALPLNECLARAEFTSPSNTACPPNGS